MVDVSKVFVVEPLAAKSYKKCGLCGRIRSLFYRLTVRDTQAGTAVIATLQLCDNCGRVFGDIIGKPTHLGQTTRRIKL